MSRPRLLWISDFKADCAIPLLTRFYQQYSEHYDILISGYHLEYAEKRLRENLGMAGPYPTELTSESSITCRVNIRTMNSTSFLLYKHTAEYVVITTPAAAFLKEKRNQILIFIPDHFDPISYAGCIGEVDLMITDDSKIAESFVKMFPFVPMKCIDPAKEELTTASGIRREHSHPAESYIVLSLDGGDSILMDEWCVGSWLLQKTGDPANNLIAVSAAECGKMFTSGITMNNSSKVLQLVREFDGTILYDSVKSKSYFEDLFNRTGIMPSSGKRSLFSEYKLMPLMEADGVRDRERTGIAGDDMPADLPEHIKYRKLLERLYEKNRYDEVKVSILICRYNTEEKLLARAIRSALNCGHRNLEVMIIDDGSEEMIDERFYLAFQDERIITHYRKHEGLGGSRNYGIDTCTGKYFFFLDADDEMVPDGLKMLVAHAEFYQVLMVAGKRIHCDADRNVYNESIPQLCGETFRCFRSVNCNVDVFADGMINNKLIHTETMRRLGFRFLNKGYEDLRLSARLYTQLQEYHFVSIPVYYWYHYGVNSTISSTVTLQRFKDRLYSEIDLWKFVPEQVRPMRLISILAWNFNLFIERYHMLSCSEQKEVHCLLREYLEERKKYLRLEAFPRKQRELIQALLHKDESYLLYVASHYYQTPQKEVEHDNYVIATHAQLYAAMVIAIEHQHCSHRARLFISQDQTCVFRETFNTLLLMRLRETGLFEYVEIVSFGDVNGDMQRELLERPGDEAIVIPKHLCNRFREPFRMCDSKNDIMLIFANQEPFMYYIEREFKNVLQIEQGIKSSKEFADMEERHLDEIREYMLSVYDSDTEVLQDVQVIIMTAPLAARGHCTRKQQKKLVHRICTDYDPKVVAIKPHPGDSVKYQSLGMRVLPKSVPIELYLYLETTIEEIVAIDSEDLPSKKSVVEKTAVFDFASMDQKEIKAIIKAYINRENQDEEATDRQGVFKTIRSFSTKTKSGFADVGKKIRKLTRRKVQK